MEFAFSRLAVDAATIRSPAQQLPDIWTTIAFAGVNLPLREMPMVTAPAALAPTIPPSSALSKRRRFKRTLFTDAQRQILSSWLNMHKADPYPTTGEKELLMRETGLHRDQINVWFTHNRIRQGFTSMHRLTAPPTPGFRASIRV
jgi:hypothetical protein